MERRKWSAAHEGYERRVVSDVVEGLVGEGVMTLFYGARDNKSRRSR